MSTYSKSEFLFVGAWLVHVQGAHVARPYSISKAARP